MLRVLVIDDEPDVRAAIGMILRFGGVAVVVWEGMAAL